MRQAAGARTAPGVDSGRQAGHGLPLVWTERGRRGTDRPWVDRGDRTGIGVGRTQRGRKRHQRYRSKGGGWEWGSLGGYGHKMESQMGGVEFGHKGVAVTMVGDSLQYAPSGEAEVGRRGWGARGRWRGRGPSGHGPGQRYWIQVTDRGFLRLKETLLCDKQERQVNKLEADEPEISGPCLELFPRLEGPKAPGTSCKLGLQPCL